MESNANNACFNVSQPSICFENAIVDCKINEKNALDSLYVNHAEVAWHERRRAWVGDISQRSQRLQSISIREKILSWSTTCKELLSTVEPFKDPIPLAEMVDSLVDIWLEEGLYGSRVQEYTSRLQFVKKMERKGQSQEEKQLMGCSHL